MSANGFIMYFGFLCVVGAIWPLWCRCAVEPQQNKQTNKDFCVSVVLLDVCLTFVCLWMLLSYMYHCTVYRPRTYFDIWSLMDLLNFVFIVNAIPTVCLLIVYQYFMLEIHQHIRLFAKQSRMLFFWHRFIFVQTKPFRWACFRQYHELFIVYAFVKY